MSIKEFIDYFKGFIPRIMDFAVDIIIACLIFFIGRKIIKVLLKWIRKIMNKGNLDEGVKSFLDSLLKLALNFLLVVLVISRFGITTSSIIALLGSAGLAVGLALQGSLSNFAGGVLILILRPFEVGDYIRMADGNEGTVSQIQVCYTRLLTVDNQMIVIPNGTLSNMVITNVTKLEKRRVDLKVSVSYDTDLKKAQAIIRRLLERVESKIPEEDINVFVAELGASEVVLCGRVWVTAEDYWNVKWRLNEEIVERYREEGIRIPYPQLDVHVKK